MPHRAARSFLLIPALAAFSIAAGPPQSRPASVPLKDAVIAEDLPQIIGIDHLGLGAEARALIPWIRSHPKPFILRPHDLLLQDAASGTLALSATMARTLSRLDQWRRLEAPKDNPITHAQLRGGALSPASIARIRAIFEAMIERGVRIGPKWLTPETGGEATLDTELRLVEARDPRWSTIQDLVKAAGDARAIAGLCERRAAQVAVIDTHGLLKVAVARFRLGSPGSAEEVRRALLTVAQNAAPTYSLGPEEQLTLVTSTDWQGRYVGGWHTHAPHHANGGWIAGDVPSFEDMQNAIQYGQYLTLAFQPDGFDLYDAEALGDAKRVDLSLLKVIRYRSAEWREHFRSLHPSTKGGS
ncbi:MAG: hypothetical protein K1Y01_20250 [Vicinamibacteria bacterium]|nr:hypothetical protein [Vicinamibacteria bacterium]